MHARHAPTRTCRGKHRLLTSLWWLRRLSAKKCFQIGLTGRKVWTLRRGFSWGEFQVVGPTKEKERFGNCFVLFWIKILKSHPRLFVFMRLLLKFCNKEILPHMKRKYERFFSYLDNTKQCAHVRPIFYFISIILTRKTLTMRPASAECR